MNKILFIIIISTAGLMIQCANNSNSDIDKEEVEINEWYEGGTLHKAKVIEWKKATERNKLATCADYMAKVDDSVTMEVIKERATILKECIDEATRDLESTNDKKVSAIAAICITMMQNL